MSYTGKYLNFFSEGFQTIKDFGLSPCNWAAEGCGEHQTDNDNYTAEILECGVCLICDCMVCCCKMPVACVGELVTLPLAGSAAIIFGLLCVAGLPFVAAADGVDACAEHCCKADSSEIQGTVTKTVDVDEKSKDDQEVNIPNPGHAP